MHLILTSCDFLNDNSKNCIITNLKTPVEKCKILFIPNEKATFETIQSEKYYEKAVSEGKYKVYALTDDDSIVIDN